MRAVPTRCDECGSVKIHLMKLGKRQAARRKHWPYVYHCRSCNAETGCHTGTIFPLGLMACPRTRYMRTEAHKVFDRLWNNKDGMSRQAAYQQLASHLGLTREQCHIGLFNETQCRQVIAFAHETRKHMRKRR